ncbi:hypothetical protein C8J56DRAFT_186239 [Mycena floridula]|nr:hypothetical protein C8J56DRAFT_186239 [Mycena floridula]
MSTPVTPQRRPVAHCHSVSQSHFRSPISPASPYTPLSLRSFASSNPSPLTTPASVKNYPFHAQRLSFSSPQVRGTSNSSQSISRDKSLADVAKNWRSRASENGIRVSSGADFVDDDSFDQSFSETNDSSFMTNEDTHLSPPFLATRRRALSQSQVMLPPATSPLTRKIQPTSPLSFRSSGLNQSVAATPPPNRKYAQQKLKGSFTDPPKPRQRDAFAVVPQRSQNIPRSNNHDMSLDLFDIDENDYEYHDFQSSSVADDSYSYETGVTKHDTLHEYTPYPLMSNSHHVTALMPSFGQPAFADPFISSLGDGYPLTSPMSDTLEQHFYQYPNQYSSQYVQQPRQALAQPHPQLLSMLNQPMQAASIANSTFPNSMSTNNHSKSRLAPVVAPIASPAPEEAPTSCSVCSRANPSRLAILSPCNHPLCSGCLTSALNIVGEKDMECAVCKRGVDDFKLISLPAAPTSEKRPPFGQLDVNRTNKSQRKEKQDEATAKGKSFMDLLFSSPGSAVTAFSGVDSFAFLGSFDDAIDGPRCSTPPPPGLKRPGPQRDSREFVVLRIDNVPWDITPPSIATWLQQPIERAHVLLDRKGKTLSHAFVEVKSAEIAGAILRGEASNSTTGRGDISSAQGRGAVLGRGRRARGVTITRSSQEELMAALFPSWRGSFDGARPSLAGLGNGHVVGALESGLMTDSEVVALLYLLRSPDAHFLKVPSLPFHGLISILSKFPADADSRVFWSASLRDSLYDVAYAAVKVLLGRIEVQKSNSNEEHEIDENRDLVDSVVRAALQCQAFTPQQIATFTQFLESQSESPSSSEYNQQPQESSNSSGSHESPYNPDADVEDEGEGDDQENLDWQTPSSTTVASSAGSDQDNAAAVEQSVDPASSNSIGDLAREFGVETDLVQALVDRLALR